MISPQNAKGWGISSVPAQKAVKFVHTISKLLPGQGLALQEHSKSSLTQVQTCSNRSLYTISTVLSVNLYDQLENFMYIFSS